MAGKREFDLQDRLIDYAVRIIKLCDALPNNRTGKHICSQISILFRSIETAKKNAKEGR